MKQLIRKLSIALIMTFAVTMLLNIDVVEAKTQKFNVLFMYGPKQNLQQVSQGRNAKVPTDVDVPGYTFIGWTDTAANIQCDKIIIGMYAPAVPVIAPVTVPVVPVAAPVVVYTTPGVKKISDKISAPGEPWWDYTLKGTPGQTCVLRWYNGHNGELWKIEMVPYGITLPNPQDPCLEGYEFVGWEGSWVNITEDRNIMAAYYHLNKITYMNEDGRIFDTRWVRDGSDVPTSNLNYPWREGEDHYDYEFVGDMHNVKGDRIIRAVRKDKPKKDDDD